MTELHLIARLAGRLVAIGGDQVDSVVDLGEIVSVPLAAPSVCGLAALRSRVVAVIDPRVALGVPGSTRPSRAIISTVEGSEYAFLVDAAEDVASFERQPLGSGIALGGGWREAARGLIERDGEPILLIDLRVLVPALAPVAAAA